MQVTGLQEALEQGEAFAAELEDNIDRRQLVGPAGSSPDQVTFLELLFIW